jgi:polar amino acid transport system substrate-binding protein
LVTKKWDVFTVKKNQTRAMKQIILLSCLLLFGIPDYASGWQPDSEPVVILYNDSTGTIDLNDIETQPRPNRIIYHMLNVVLPKEYGINIKLKPILWTRGLELIKTGLADGIADASYNDKRAAYAVYPMKGDGPDPSKILRSIEYSLYKNKNSTITWDGTRLDDIDGDIVSVRSFAIVSDLRKNGITVQEEPNLTGIIRSLAIGKFKSAALQNYMVDEFLANNPALKENIIKVEPPLKRKEYYLIFSKKFYDEHKELAKEIWDAIEDYRSTDEYRQMKKEFEK